MITFTDPLFWIIASGSLAASFVNAAFAVGGAFVMLAVMTSILPIEAVIPLHSTMMMGSLISRVYLFWQYIQWSIVFPFVMGCFIGVFFGARIYIDLPDWIIASVLGLLMLSVWLPNPRWKLNIPRPFFFVGAIHSFVSTVFSYGGIFQTVILRTGLPRLQITATVAGSILTMAVMKIIGYSAFGFEYKPYLWVILATVMISFVGTWIGKHVTHHISEEQFKRFFKVIMTLFGLRLLYQAWQLF